MAVLSISSCTDKKTKISETKELDTIDCNCIEEEIKPQIINQDSILKQMGHSTLLDSSLVRSAESLSTISIPIWVFKMKNLKKLEIWGMDCKDTIENNCYHVILGDCFRILEIPSQIKEIPTLTSLRLPNNDILTIPIELATLKNLKEIDLSYNSGIDNVEIIEKIVSLEFLSLEGCQLTSMPANIGNLKHLKVLQLEGDYFKEEEKIRIKKALPNCKITFSKPF